MPTISAIHHIALTVSDLERSVAWYTETLGLTNLTNEIHPDGSGHAVVLGTPDWSWCVSLHTHKTNDSEAFAEQRTGLDHVSFLVPSRAELDQWQLRLTERGVPRSAVTDRDGYSSCTSRESPGRRRWPPPPSHP